MQAPVRRSSDDRLARELCTMQKEQERDRPTRDDLKRAGNVSAAWRQSRQQDSKNQCDREGIDKPA
jgi:ribosomal protein L32E